MVGRRRGVGTKLPASAASPAIGGWRNTWRRSRYSFKSWRMRSRSRGIRRRKRKAEGGKARAGRSGSGRRIAESGRDCRGEAGLGCPEELGAGGSRQAARLSALPTGIGARGRPEASSNTTENRRRSALAPRGVSSSGRAWPRCVAGRKRARADRRTAGNCSAAAAGSWLDWREHCRGIQPRVST